MDMGTVLKVHAGGLVMWNRQMEYFWQVGGHYEVIFTLL